jgi:hypothetical protein
MWSALKASRPKPGLWYGILFFSTMKRIVQTFEACHAPVMARRSRSVKRRHTFKLRAPLISPHPRLHLSHLLTEEPVIQIGEVTYVGDGIIHVSGLDKARIDEIVEIKTRKGLIKALILGFTGKPA